MEHTCAVDVQCAADSNFRPVAEFLTIQAGYDHCRLNNPIPFVVRNCAEFLPATHDAICQQIRLEQSIRGYNDKGTHQLKGLEAFELWKHEQLDFNIVDSCSSRGSLLLPETLRALNIANDVESAIWLAYVLTASAVQGKMHIDPPFGSGWQYLSCGTKCWTIIDRDFFRAAVAPVLPVLPLVAPVLAEVVLFEVTRTKRFSVVQVVAQTAVVILDPVSLIEPIVVPLIADTVALAVLGTADAPLLAPVVAPVVGRARYPHQYVPADDYDVETLAKEYPQELYRVVLNATDFLSCPEDWPHSVYTSQKTCGLSGYMKYKISA